MRASMPWGLRRRGFKNARIEEVHHAYRLVYQSGFNTSQAISQIELEVAGKSRA